MDNVSIHHANKACKKLGLSSIKELLESKNIEPIYLPPYTPELNPTELCFNFIKGQVEKYKPETFEELELVLKEVLDHRLHKKDMTKFFSHCSEYFEYKNPKKGWIRVNPEEEKKSEIYFLRNNE